MLLPRPARLIRQYPKLLHPSVHRYAPARAVRAAHTYDVDESYHPHMDDMTMGSSRQRPTVSSQQPEVLDLDHNEAEGSGAAGPLSALTSSFEKAEYDEDEGGREERRAPATVLGTKRVGLVILPELLTNAIQQEINGKLMLPQ